MSAPHTIASITFDCSDAASLARFWAQLLGREVAAGATSDYASVDGDPAFTFIAVPEDKRAKNRMHLDIAVDVLADAVVRAVELGAEQGEEFDEDGYHWVTCADPEGNEFDLVVLPS